MPILGIDQFKSQLAGGGARPTLFQVTCNFPGFAGGNSPKAAFMIKAASLPASTQGDIKVKYQGRELKIAGDRVFDQWTIRVINDVPTTLRDAFERWMNGINNHKSNTGRGRPNDYMTDMRVDQLDKSGNAVKSYIFRGCFPVSVGAIDLSYESTDQIEEFDVVIDYQYWESTSTPASSGVGGSFGASVGVGAAVNVGGVSVGGSVNVGI